MDGSAPETEAGGMVNRDALSGYVQSIVGLHEQRDELNAEIKQVYDQAKEAGFVTSMLRKVVTEYRMEAEERAAQYALLDAYRSALGLLAGTPLGEAAERATGLTKAPPLVDGDEVIAASARAIGRQDGLAGTRNAAHLYPQGSPFHADYELGFVDGQRGIADSLAPKANGSRRGRKGEAADQPGA